MIEVRPLRTTGTDGRRQVGIHAADARDRIVALPGDVERVVAPMIPTRNGSFISGPAECLHRAFLPPL